MKTPVPELSATVQVAAPAATVYDLVSDLTRMGEWSPENTGGQWLDGATGPAVGARFKGNNRRKAAWNTSVVVTEAERGVAFAFATGRKAPRKPDTLWRYAFADLPDGGCRVTETCQISAVPGRIGDWLTKLGTGVAWAERPADMQRGMEETLRRLGAASEAAARTS